MANFSNIQPNYQPPQQSPQLPVSAVNINIINPQAYGNGATQTPAPPVQVPVPYPVQTQAPQALYPTSSIYNNYAAPVQYPPNYNNNFNNTAMSKVDNSQNTQTDKTEKTDDTKKKDDKKKTKVLLTDDYIKSLENYLDNGSAKIRLMGAKELLERFKEDDKRKDDAALTALLNKALQDTSSTVRFMALTTLDVGYANGNRETIDLLKQIQQKGYEQYGEDAIMASQVLLKLSGSRVEVPQGDTNDGN